MIELNYYGKNNKVVTNFSHKRVQGPGNFTVKLIETFKDLSISKLLRLFLIIKKRRKSFQFFPMKQV